jgi:hypothetical protein
MSRKDNVKRLAALAEELRCKPVKTKKVEKEEDEQEAKKPARKYSKKK